MKMISTRGNATRFSISEAIRRGLAPDGGLFVPERLPHIDPRAVLDAPDMPTVAARVLAPWFVDDPLVEHLETICREVFTLPVPLVDDPTPDDARLELIHGPTAAFKDFGARFLGACLQRLADRPIRVVVATSGDTGAAVAAALDGRERVEVHVLHPHERVSPRQAHMLGSYGDNVHSYAVRGSFDDCQRMVKELLGCQETVERHNLTSANSINIGRLLPQMAYYAGAVRVHGLRDARRLGFVVPTGNLGNAVAAVWAKATGVPIGTIALATNANRTIGTFLDTGVVPDATVIPTIANAMDVAVPSNLERLRWTHGSDESWRDCYPHGSYDDRAIRDEVARRHEHDGVILCPHTATAHALRRELRAAGHDEPLAVVATAHPAKFAEVLEPVVGVVPMPRVVEEALARPASHTALEPSASVWLDTMLESRLEPAHRW
ncbi:MAG: threonine synthase [Acidobacteriota bacterium]